jgi:hypothetical protein
MKKSAERVLNMEINKILAASNYKVVKEALGRLVGLSDALDKLGDEKGADRVDGIVKESGSWLEDLLGGGATGGASTIWNAIKGGRFDKATLVTLVKKTLEGGAIFLIADSIMEQIAKIPYVGTLFNNETVRTLISGGLTFAITNSDFVDKFVDHLIDGVEQYFGMKTSTKPAATSGAQEAMNPSPNASKTPAAVPGAPSTW